MRTVTDVPCPTTVGETEITVTSPIKWYLKRFVFSGTEIFEIDTVKSTGPTPEKGERQVMAPALEVLARTTASPNLH
jgi:hypothetical protein